MSCHLLSFSYIGEIKSVRDFLFPPLKGLPSSFSAQNLKNEKGTLYVDYIQGNIPSSSQGTE